MLIVISRCQKKKKNLVTSFSETQSHFGIGLGWATLWTYHTAHSGVTAVIGPLMVLALLVILNLILGPAENIVKIISDNKTTLYPSLMERCMAIYPKYDLSS